MKALTIRQPWAHAIIRDGKDVENRTWAPPIAAMPFRMAVHAGDEPPDWPCATLRALGGEGT